MSRPLGGHHKRPPSSGVGQSSSAVPQQTLPGFASSSKPFASSPLASAPPLTSSALASSSSSSSNATSIPGLSNVPDSFPPGPDTSSNPAKKTMAIFEMPKPRSNVFGQQQMPQQAPPAAMQFGSFGGQGHGHGAGSSYGVRPQSAFAAPPVGISAYPSSGFGAPAPQKDLFGNVIEKSSSLIGTPMNSTPTFKRNMTPVTPVFAANPPACKWCC